MFIYRFRLADGRFLEFTINPSRVYTEELDAQTHAAWARLSHHRCACCPLEEAHVRHCPVAVDLQPVIEAFSSVASTAEAEVVVISPEREYRRQCPVQRGLNSMLGLLMATSACPILGRLRHLANFHLPFANHEETLFRTVGAYLIRQYFVYRAGGEPDFTLEGLDAQYRQLTEVNTYFAERIRAASGEDASSNAVVLFWSLSYLVNVSLEEQLTAEQALFAPEY